MKLIGIQRVDYTNKNGFHILGYKLHLSTPSKRKDCLGEITDVIFVSDQIFGTCDNIAIGDEVSIAYNKFGKVTSVNVIA